MFAMVIIGIVFVKTYLMVQLHHFIFPKLVLFILRCLEKIGGEENEIL